MTYFIELGKRLVACEHFRLMPGMLCRRKLNTEEHLPVRIVSMEGYTEVADFLRVEDEKAKLHVRSGVVRDQAWKAYADLIPDLSDAATKGCVLQLIREAWGDPEAHFALGAAGWSLMSGESRIADVVYTSPPSKDEAEAMVAAMEAAP